MEKMDQRRRRESSDRQGPTEHPDARWDYACFRTRDRVGVGLGVGSGGQGGPCKQCLPSPGWKAVSTKRRTSALLFTPRAEEMCFQMHWSQETKPRGFRKMLENRVAKRPPVQAGQGGKGGRGAAPGAYARESPGLTGQARGGRWEMRDAEKQDCCSHDGTRRPRSGQGG